MQGPGGGNARTDRAALHGAIEGFARRMVREMAMVPEHERAAWVWASAEQFLAGLPSGADRTAVAFTLGAQFGALAEQETGRIIQ